MKATKLFLIFLLFQLRLQAQPEFAPANSAWYYDAIIGWGGSGIVKATYTQDTIINGLALKVIERTEPTFSGPITSTMLIHQSHDTIYQVYEDVTGLSFHFLFRNEMEIGETVSFPVLYSGGTFTVMDKEATNVGGKTLVRYELTNQDTFTVNIYDVFGPQYGFFQHWLGAAFDGNDYRLRCFRANDFPLVNFTSEPCAGVNATFDEKPAEVSVTPSPVESFLRIDLPNVAVGTFDVSFFDFAGKQVYEGKADGNTNSINVAPLNPGLYFGILASENHQFRFKFVKVK